MAEQNNGSFESWCQRRRDKYGFQDEWGGHESAGDIRQYAGEKFTADLSLVVKGQKIELHVCKHCGCVFAQGKS